MCAMADKNHGSSVKINVNGELEALLRSAAEDLGLSISALGRMLLLTGLRRRGYSLPVRASAAASEAHDANREEPTDELV